MEILIIYMIIQLLLAIFAGLCLAHTIHDMTDPNSKTENPLYTPLMLFFKKRK